LTVEKRVVVALYYINDLSLQEISDTLDLPIGTVKSRLHYGRQAMKKYLGLDPKYIPEAKYETT
jgi:RNA polymerase sigma-70 factor (ECF subfamily)